MRSLKTRRQLAQIFVLAWDVRPFDLEGALAEVLSAAGVRPHLMDVPIYRHRANAAQKALVSAVTTRNEQRRSRALRAMEIVHRFAAHYNIAAEALTGSRRVRAISELRQFAMWAIRMDVKPMSFQEIGAVFGGRTHDVVLFACHKVEARFAKEPHLRDDLLAIAAGQDEERAAA